MITYTIENNDDLKRAYEKGISAGKSKHKKWGTMLNRFHIRDNPYTVTGGFGKKLKAAWHNGFKSARLTNTLNKSKT